MKVNELRLGNIVSLYNPGGNIDVAVDIQVMDIALRNEKEVMPIPLTTEWLERAGFVSGTKGVVFEQYDSDGFGFRCWATSGGQYCFNISGYYVLLQYVHQLQNLYFALTGEELEFSHG